MWFGLNEERSPSNAQGIAWMVISCFWAAVLVSIVRYLSHEMHAFEIVFLRNLFALMFMLPWAFKHKEEVFATSRYGYYFLRAFTGLCAMSCWFFALSVVPLADAVSLSFTLPIFATLGAVIFLKERCGIHRSLAVVAGFIGALIILRPGSEGFSWMSLIVLLSSLLMAGSSLIVKRLSETEPSRRIVFFFTLLITPLSIFPALFVWQWPSLNGWIWLVILGLISNWMQIAMSNAYARADLTILMPLDFLRLIFVSVFGYFLFHETLDMYTAIGAVIILASTAYTAHRERVRARDLLKKTGGHCG